MKQALVKLLEQSIQTGIDKGFLPPVAPPGSKWS